MAGILSNLFGKKFPDTRKYEAGKNQLREDYRRFLELEQSDLLKRYIELDREVHSGEFEKRVNELKHKKFKDTDQYKVLKRYNELSRDSDIKTYINFKKSGKSKKILEIQNSDAFKRFRELENFVNSTEFYKKKAEPDFKQSDAWFAFKEYKKISKKRDIKWALKTEKSMAYNTFKRLDGTNRINEYYELEATVESKEFIDFKQYMEDPNRFKKSDEAVLIKEFEELKKHKDIVWYLQKKEEKPF